MRRMSRNKRSGYENCAEKGKEGSARLFNELKGLRQSADKGHGL
jgi:hypothetical protein